MISDIRLQEELHGTSLIDHYLNDQRQLTAVDRFSQQHERDSLPAQAKYYRDLIPLDQPGDGQQYAFEVNLDACSGCKACVTACHSLNGLDDDETWRDVGLLLGGSMELPVLQHITTACHHCLEPACLNGCPVNAYEKEPVTGIVKHLDDQCIGCQYCILMCPYDVPKYNKKRGIIRKCDMCSDRLADAEAPACVQACPSEAIRISIVDQQEVVEDSETDGFLPGAPDPSYTLPTTSYKTSKVLPRNMLPANYYAVEPNHAHLSLVFMLVLTQMSVGAFLIDLLLRIFIGDSVVQEVRPAHALIALVLGIVALSASVFHLGRPIYAFRAIIGLKSSWLSREILAFGLFALLASVYAVGIWLRPEWIEFHKALGGTVVVMGLTGVLCSVMVYHSTRRVFWNGSTTGMKFFLTTIILGLSATLVTSLITTTLLDSLTAGRVMARGGYILCEALIAASVVKLLLECSVLRHLRDKRHTPLKRTARLMSDALVSVTLKRLAFGLVGGVVIPGMLIFAHFFSGTELNALFACTLAIFVLVLTLAGELMERYLFFSAVVSPKMPGGVM